MNDTLSELTLHFELSSIASWKYMLMSQVGSQACSMPLDYPADAATMRCAWDFAAFCCAYSLRAKSLSTPRATAPPPPWSAVAPTRALHSAHFPTLPDFTQPHLSNPAFIADGPLLLNAEKLGRHERRCGAFAWLHELPPCLHDCRLP